MTKPKRPPEYAQLRVRRRDLHHLENVLSEYLTAAVQRFHYADGGTAMQHRERLGLYPSCDEKRVALVLLAQIKERRR